MEQAVLFTKTMKHLYLCLTMENTRVLYQKMILLQRIFWNFKLHYYVKNYGTMKKKGTMPKYMIL